MNPTFERIRVLISQRKVRISVHAYHRMSKRGILPTEVIKGALNGEVLEDYPKFHLGPAVLLLQGDDEHRPLHSVWGIEKGTDEPAVLMTAYRPDPSEWTDDFRRRKT